MTDTLTRLRFHEYATDLLAECKPAPKMYHPQVVDLDRRRSALRRIKATLEENLNEPTPEWINGFVMNLMKGISQ